MWIEFCEWICWYLLPIIIGLVDVFATIVYNIHARYAF